MTKRHRPLFIKPATKRIALVDRVLNDNQRRTFKLVAWGYCFARRMPWAGGNAFGVFVYGENKPLSGIDGLRNRRWLYIVHGRVTFSRKGWIAFSQLLLEEWPC